MSDKSEGDRLRIISFVPVTVGGIDAAEPMQSKQNSVLTIDIFLLTFVVFSPEPWTRGHIAQYSTRRSEKYL